MAEQAKNYVPPSPKTLRKRRSQPPPVRTPISVIRLKKQQPTATPRIPKPPPIPREALRRRPRRPTLSVVKAIPAPRQRPSSDPEASVVCTTIVTLLAAAEAEPPPAVPDRKREDDTVPIPLERPKSGSFPLTRKRATG